MSAYFIVDFTHDTLYTITYTQPVKGNIMTKVVVRELQCKHTKKDGTVCGYTWIPRKKVVMLCPKCKSPYWDGGKGK